MNIFNAIAAVVNGQHAVTSAASDVQKTLTDLQAFLKNPKVKTLSSSDPELQALITSITADFQVDSADWRSIENVVNAFK